MKRFSGVCLLSTFGLISACNGSAAPSDQDNFVPAPDYVAPCASELAYFEAHAWQPTLSVFCIGCHNEAGPAKGSRMVLWPETRAGYLEHNFQQAFTVATTGTPNAPLLLLMPTNTNPMRAHPGGELFKADSESYAQLQGFVSRAWTEVCETDAAPQDCTTVTPGPRMLRRLTPTEYDNTIETLFGIDSTHGATFPADVIVDGFRNNADALTVTPLMADKLQAAAETIAAQVDIAPFQSCTLDAEHCGDGFITKLGTQVFRRPPTAEEITRYRGLFAAVDGFDAGCRLIVNAMLQSPNFLYRSELGVLQGDNSYLLSDYEIASELSYLLWQTMPDATLFDAAKASQLHTDAQIDAQVTRMLADPRARPTFRRFILEWLGIDNVLTVPRDSVAFPELDADLRNALLAEAERLIDQVVFDSRGTLTDLLTTPMSQLDATLADFYGVDVSTLTQDSSGFYNADLTSKQRSGVLTLGASMLAHARSNASSPVHRGRFVRERLLCQVPPPPPPGLNVQPPAVDPTLTTRERYSAHSVMEPCRSCHQLMDPIGFAFEHFDGIGRYRDTENGHAIDVTGEILRSKHSDATFEGTDQLATLLADSSDVEECFARQSFRFGYGLHDGNSVSCAVNAVHAAIEASDYSIQGMVSALTRGVHFKARVRADVPVINEPLPMPNEDAGAMMPMPNEDAGAMQPSDAGATDETGLALEQIQNDDWGAGYCRGYRVTNHTGAAMAWTITLVVDGTVSNAWEAERNADSGAVTFRGNTQNATLADQASVSFGYCATR